MVELRHRAQVPAALTQFITDHPNLTAADFDAKSFLPVKREVRAALHVDQGGLCVYCERKLANDSGQVEHLWPKGGPHARPDLTFHYENLAHGCTDNCTCGQKKKHGVLPIMPGAGCNDQFFLSIDGTITPQPDLTRKQRHPVQQTLEMLGLTAKQSPHLAAERKEWVDVVMHLLQSRPELVATFLADKPFRHILRRLMP